MTGWSYLTDVLVVVTEAEKQMGENVYNVRFKEPPQHHTQHLKGKQRTWWRNFTLVFDVEYIPIWIQRNNSLYTFDL